MYPLNAVISLVDYTPGIIEIVDYTQTALVVDSPIVFESAQQQPDAIPRVADLDVWPTEAVLRNPVGPSGFRRFEYSGPPISRYGVDYKPGSYINPNVGKPTATFVPPILFNAATQRFVNGVWELLADDGTWQPIGSGGGGIEIVETEEGKFSIRGPLANDPTRKVVYEQE